MTTVQISSQVIIQTPVDPLPKRCASFKYHIFNKTIMCEMIDEIEIEHLRMVLARARKEMQEPVKEEPLIAIA